MFELLSPAKLNLFLHIVGRREDGYHELQTAFQFLDYCDILHFELNHNESVTRTDVVEKYTNDLILQAGNLLKALVNQPKLGANIYLTKNIPTGGGLGGGSSNAATTLVGLNHLWKLGLSKNILADIGLQLGADVPVFINGFSSFAEGIGEILSPISPKELWFLVINPRVHVSTLKIFCAKELTRDSTRIKIPHLLDGLDRNDCLSVVHKMYPEVKKAMYWLDNFAKAQLTGTGGCIFASFAEKNKAELLLKQLPSKWDGFVAQGKNHSPLYEV